ncbi:hypothetical protein LSCM1_06741 [Leishmania martiniquensis]|uniref:Uncharacterized protein n=1 Tax=Leishmania martiniquensis TaxID=1580590 RepID=A0A836GVU8_9TRYP|nr:hypothetical protein LSCM1_06741 [Leishmania martiniquensis]
MRSWRGRGSLVRRVAATACCTASTTSSLLFYSSRRIPREHLSRRRDSLLPRTVLSTAHAQAKIKPQQARLRGGVQRRSLLEQLRGCDDSGTSTAESSKASAGGVLIAPAPAVSLSTPTHHSAASEFSPYLSSSEFVSAPRPKQGQQTWSLHGRQSAAAEGPSSLPSASAELEQQQRALRDAFTHARQHHNVRLAKDLSVYRAECRAFRQAHRGRSPTPQEVSRIVAVPLAPVAALKALAHTDRTKSSLHAMAEAAVMLHNAVVKNELVKSSTPQLVRCLRCFHVYTARPRTLWGGEVEQSGIEYEKAQKARLLQSPAPGRRTLSVGRRRGQYEENPVCCPECRSPRAQWMMEYVHHHTHEKV